ncbi:MAG: hypothetical protein RIS47_1420 [Bacteroidota bacterium]|jgi:3-dehydroquinate synthase
MQISSLDSVVLIGEPLEKSFEAVLKACKPERIFVLTDENTLVHCLPVLQKVKGLREAPVYTIGAGEDHKSIASAEKIWDFLTQNHADRHSLLVNLGGGMVGDLGGFAASTFKRGMDFVNIPTTLLAQVDASIGGKLGVNFAGYKNHIGIFGAPKFVIVVPEFLETLDKDNILSGYAEMLKHALIYSAEHWRKLKEIKLDDASIDLKALDKLITKSILIKNDFVQKDFREKNIRKALNFGHTVGHAIESMLIERGTPILHGAAVAHGLVCECYLSYKKHGLPLALVHEIRQLVLSNYGVIDNLASNFNLIMSLMSHDKKNENARINFTLISGFGDVEINQICTEADIKEALVFYNAE